MGDNSLTRESLCRKLAKYEEQYDRAMAEYCLLNEGIEFPSPAKIKEKASELKKITFQKPLFIKTIKKPKKLCLSIKYAWSELIVRENDYYNHLAICSLFQIGIKNPNAAQISEENKVSFSCQS